MVVGVGGYASAAIVSVAAKMGIPVLLQEQNSYAGIVNKKNGKNADKICVAYDNMERFFPKDKIILTGNPIRKDIAKATQQQKEEGFLLPLFYSFIYIFLDTSIRCLLQLIESQVRFTILRELRLVCI